MKKLFLIAAGLLLSLPVVAAPMKLGDGYMGCQAPKTKQQTQKSVQLSASASGAQTPVTNTYLYGIDISGHQGTINWTQVKGAKDFALIKASEGYNFSDSYFVANRNGARSSGILRGFYHYARPDLGNSGTAEADSFVNIVGTFQSANCLCWTMSPSSPLLVMTIQTRSPGARPGWTRFMPRPA